MLYLSQEKIILKRREIEKEKEKEKEEEEEAVFSARKSSLNLNKKAPYFGGVGGLVLSFSVRVRVSFHFSAFRLA